MSDVPIVQNGTNSSEAAIYSKIWWLYIRNSIKTTDNLWIRDQVFLSYITEKSMLTFNMNFPLSYKYKTHVEHVRVI